MKKVVIALSGGVDSSVAALILKKMGYYVIGLFMNNWYDSSFSYCTWKEDSIDAMLVANSLKIPFQIIDMKKEYKKHVIDYMFREYKYGNTPNPDIICNKKIKFDSFLQLAIKKFKADFIATGHYVNKQIIKKNNKIIYSLLMGKDINKDQSYFLCQLTQFQIKKSLFPLGSLTKKKVRKIAVEYGFINALKKDSQGLCFVGKINLCQFLQTKIKKKKGEIININRYSNIYNKINSKKLYSIEQGLLYLYKKIEYNKSYGKIIGYHDGSYYFTKGQRKGLSIGGLKEAIFVIETDTKNNIIYTGIGKDHPGLYKKILFIKEQDIHWIRKDLSICNGMKMNVFGRIRYQQKLQNSILYKIESGMLVEFFVPQYAITEGQFFAWYLGKELIGSGVIS